MRCSRPLTTVLLAGAVVFATAACSQTVAMESAPDATDVGCAEVVVRLPSDVVGLEKRETNAQGTGAWGDPAQVLLRCGVVDPAPSSECITERDVDWKIDDSDPAFVKATTYGRDPIIDVILDANLTGGREILAALAPAVSQLAPAQRCTTP